MGENKYDTGKQQCDIEHIVQHTAMRGGRLVGTIAHHIVLPSISGENT